LLNVRREPGTNAAIVDTLRQNSTVTITETRDGWGRTDRGWVSMAWVKAV
jgi:N-acetylmuramoyl-L-alanine amidase